jgi:hypothetical protein
MRGTGLTEIHAKDHATPVPHDRLAVLPDYPLNDQNRFLAGGAGSVLEV